jgi:hemolysin activation/secretion protein
VAPAPARDRRLSSGAKVTLRGLRFEGNTVFDGATLTAAVADYLDQRIGTEDLLALRDRITRYYVDAGYINSGAVIPDQEVEGGIVTVRIVEGRLGAIDLSGLDGLRPGFVEDRLRLGAGPPLDVDRLRESMQILIADPAIDRLNARLSPGAAPGESRLALEVVETPRFQPELRIANDRSPSVGAERAELSLRIGNILGLSDPVRFELGLTRGLREAAVDYSVPLTADDLRLAVGGELTKSEVVEEPFNVLDVQSESQRLSIGLSYPLLRTAARELRLETSLERKRSVTSLLGRRFSFSEGVADGESVVTALRVAQLWQARDADQVVVLRHAGSIGLDLLDATTNGAELPDGRFFAWLGQGQYLRRLADTDWQLRLRADLQLTPDRLLPIERIAIGGSDTVRGYRENQLVLDNGWVLSAELQAPLGQWRLPGVGGDLRDGALQLVSFVDAGGGWNVETATPADHTLVSIGLGLRWQPTRRLDLRLEAGMPLLDLPDPADHDLQDLGLHFA